MIISSFFLCINTVRNVYEWSISQSKIQSWMREREREIDYWINKKKWLVISFEAKCCFQLNLPRFLQPHTHNGLHQRKCQLISLFINLLKQLIIQMMVISLSSLYRHSLSMLLECLFMLFPRHWELWWTKDRPFFPLLHALRPSLCHYSNGVEMVNEKPWSIFRWVTIDIPKNHMGCKFVTVLHSFQIWKVSCCEYKTLPLESSFVFVGTKASRQPIKIRIWLCQ